MQVAEAGPAVGGDVMGVGGGTGEVVGPTTVGDTGGGGVGESESAPSALPQATRVTATTTGTARWNRRALTRAPFDGITGGYRSERSLIASGTHATPS